MHNIQELIKVSGGLISRITLLLAGAGLLIFLWGLASFIFKVGGSEKAVEEGRNKMTWGLLALFVMMSVWGIIGFFQREFNLPTPSATHNAPSPGNAPVQGNPGPLRETPQLLNPPVEGNTPEPVILPSRNPVLTPGNAPQQGNAPEGPSQKPWYYFGF